MLRCEARIHRDVAVVEALGLEIMRRYARLADPTLAADAEPAPAVIEMVRRQAPKRVALQFLGARPRLLGSRQADLNGVGSAR